MNWTHCFCIVCSSSHIQAQVGLCLECQNNFEAFELKWNSTKTDFFYLLEYDKFMSQLILQLKKGIHPHVSHWLGNLLGRKLLSFLNQNQSPLLRLIFQQPIVVTPPPSEIVKKKLDHAGCLAKGFS